MEWIGEEKKIQASFHELRLEDERVQPGFPSVWNGARSQTVHRRRSALDSRVAVALLVVCVAFSFILAVKYWQRSQRSNYVVANGAIRPDASSAQIKESRQPVTLAGGDRREPVGRKPGPVGFASRRQLAKRLAAQSAARSAMAISQWQSPTATLLRSPADELLRSLPQLNVTANELKSFLPGRSN